MGKVLKFKPATSAIVGATASKEEQKKAGTIGGSTATSHVKETFFDMETGEEISKEEHEKRKKERERADLAGIDEEEDDEENGKADVTASGQATSSK